MIPIIDKWITEEGLQKQRDAIAQKIGICTFECDKANRDKGIEEIVQMIRGTIDASLDVLSFNRVPKAKVNMVGQLMSVGAMAIVMEISKRRSDESKRGTEQEAPGAEAPSQEADTGQAGVPKVQEQ